MASTNDMKAKLALDSKRLNSRGFYAAGDPKYVRLFGRDALIAALQHLEREPEVAKSTLMLLARLQGLKKDDKREEEPGKILRTLRKGFAPEICQFVQAREQVGYLEVVFPMGLPLLWLRRQHCLVAYSS